MLDSGEQFDRHSMSLEQWAALYRNRASQLSPSSRDWNAALDLAGAAIAVDQSSRDALEGHLRSSNCLFRPLADPLTVDLGAHRWLTSEREEAYSDWFAWVLDQVGDAEQILHLLSENDPSIRQGLNLGNPEIRREVPILDRRRRPDLVVREREHPYRPIIAIEIKTKSFDCDDVSKQLIDYAQWASSHQSPRCFFLVVDLGEFQCPSGFEPLSWREISLRIRKLAWEWVQESNEQYTDNGKLLRAAMVLAFCSAVEHNLLGVSGKPKKFGALASEQFLQEWLTRAGGDTNEQI